jgi:hypothetical protein
MSSSESLMRKVLTETDIGPNPVRSASYGDGFANG